MTRDTSVFVKCDAIFSLFFVEIATNSNFFCKVVQQHTEGMVGHITWLLLEIYFSLEQWKNLENPFKTDKIIAMSLMYYFFGT